MASSNYPGTLGTRGFSRMRREFSVLAEGRHNFGQRPKTRAAKPREKTSGTERCFLPSPLTFDLFIGLHLRQSNWKSPNVIMWTGTWRNVQRLTLSFNRKTSWSLKFIVLREIMSYIAILHSWCSLSLSCNTFFEIWSENHYLWEFNILLKTLTSVTKHYRKPSHSRTKRKSLIIMQIQEALWRN